MGWGCPLEIQRRDELVKSGIFENVSTAEEYLTKSRFQRIRQALAQQLSTVDLALFQEVDIYDSWDTIDASFVPEKMAWASCPSPEKSTTMQKILYRTDMFQLLRAQLLNNDAIPGCIAAFHQTDDSAKDSLWSVNVHDSANMIRNPRLRPTAVAAFASEIAQTTNVESISSLRLLLCGDWNVQLSLVADLLPGFTPGMLPNNSSGSVFSTNHEIGFIAQYDGCLISDGLGVTRMEISRETSGFMPKGINAALTGLFSYDSSSTHNNVIYDGTSIPESSPEHGMSDHMRVVTKLSFQPLPKQRPLSTVRSTTTKVSIFVVIAAILIVLW